MAIASEHADTTPAARRTRFAVRGLRALLGSVVIAIMLQLTGGSFWVTLVHSVCIGLCCWLAIDLGREPVARWQYRHNPDSPEAQGGWPGWPLMLPVVVIGTVIGFTVGGTIANRITGVTIPSYLRGDWRDGLLLLIGSLIPGLVITSYFYTREKMAAQQAAIEAAQRQAAEHQLKLLESQLEPHMLFNTLANLRVLIALDPPRAQQMLDQLIAFLRATLKGSRGTQHPLSAEFERLQDYLALMQVRMGERLQTRLALPPELAALPVPPLLLQPLVENCIKHGLEPKVDGGRIDIGARRDGDMLVLEVRDTGAGLGDAPVDPASFGLAQIRERLAALFGARASLVLAPAGDAEGGVRATVRLPLPAAPASP